MNKTLNNNLESLIQTNPDLCWLQKNNTQSTFAITPAKNNELTAKAQERWIASRYAPSKEARQFVEKQNIQNGDFIILYGIGLGYHLHEILKQIGKDGFLYCIEANLTLINTCLSLPHINDIISDDRFKLITGQDNELLATSFDNNILWGLDSIAKERIKIIFHEASFSIIPKEFNWIKNSLELIRFDRKGDTAFLDEMQDNIKSNIETIFNSPGIKELTSLFKNHSVIFIGAGPSLDSSIPFIKKVKKNVITVCVDTAYIPLLSNGIYPDIVISVDPQSKSYNNFISNHDHQPKIIILPTSAKEVVNNIPGEKIIAIQKNSWISNFFNNQLDPIGLTYGGSSVSVIGVDIVLQYAQNNIILAGMDFSFPKMKAYANFSPEFNNWFNKTGPLYTLQMASIENIYSQKTVFIENNFGIKIPTFQSMYRYVRALEAIINHYKKDNIYLLNPEGAKIEGTQPLVFEEEFFKLCEQDEINKKIKMKPCITDLKLKRFIEDKIKTL